MNVILVEDDLEQAEAISQGLKRHGCAVTHFSEPRLMFRKLSDFKQCVVLMDWFLPETTGLQALKVIRSKMGHTVPVVMLTSNVDEACIVEALEAGADEFVTKPASIPVLMARMAAVTRRIHSGSWLDELNLGAFKLSASARQISVDGEPIRLTPREFDLAWVLMSNAGRFVSRGELTSLLWGRGAEIDTHTITQHVYAFKQKTKLAQNGLRLHTVYGAGYRLEEMGAETENARAAARPSSTQPGFIKVKPTPPANTATSSTRTSKCGPPATPDFDVDSGPAPLSGMEACAGMPQDVATWASMQSPTPRRA